MTATQPDPSPYPFSEPEALDLHPNYSDLRKKPGMARVQMTYGQAAWLAVRYEDVRTVLGDSRFSRAKAVGPDEPRVLPFVQRSDSIFTCDPPDHTRLRRAVAAAFTKRRLDAMRPGIQALVDDLLDGLKRSGPPADLVQDFSLPLSIKVICDLLGVPYDQRDQFRAWADIILVNSPDVGVDPEQIVGAQLDLRGYLAGLVRQRRERPEEDLLSVLVRAGDEEGRLTEDEIVGLGVDVLIAGHETTSNFISNFTYLLLTTQKYAELRDAPESMPQAVEEMLRIVPMGANAFMARVATEDVELGGQMVRAGEAVLPAMASGNRDESVFDDPEQATFKAREVQHLTFGHGAHHCLGAQLGRMELQIAMSGLTRQLPELRLAVPAEAVPWRTTMLIRGPWKLPVEW
jgi:cytochrome P450